MSAVGCMSDGNDRARRAIFLWKLSTHNVLCDETQFFWFLPFFLADLSDAFFSASGRHVPPVFRSLRTFLTQKEEREKNKEKEKIWTEIHRGDGMMRWGRTKTLSCSWCAGVERTTRNEPSSFSTGKATSSSSFSFSLTSSEGLKTEPRTQWVVSFFLFIHFQRARRTEKKPEDSSVLTPRFLSLSSGWRPEPPPPFSPSCQWTLKRITEWRSKRRSPSTFLFSSLSCWKAASIISYSPSNHRARRAWKWHHCSRHLLQEKKSGAEGSFLFFLLFSLSIIFGSLRCTSPLLHFV